MHQGGMTVLEAIRAATHNPAVTFGLDHEIGSLAPGKLADLFVVDGNPLDDIRATKEVRLTMVNGRLYDADALDEIGNYDRKRNKFYWEREAYDDIQWNSTEIIPTP